MNKTFNRSSAHTLFLTILWLIPSISFISLSDHTMAHHSVSGQFDVKQRQQWVGTITKVDWINPHIYLHLAIEGEDGQITHWQLESHPPAFLRKARISKSMISGKEGETVTIDGLPGLDASKHIGYMFKITYEDGHFYQLVNQ